MTKAPSPNPSGNSGNIVKWVAIGCGGMLLLTIGLIAGLFFFIQRSFNVSTDSQQAEQSARQMMDYTIPGGSQGVVSLNISGMEFAGVTGNDGKVFLMLGKLPASMQASSDQIQAEIQKNLEQQQGSFTIKEKRTESRQLCGQTVSVTIAEGARGAGQESVPAIAYQTTVKHQDTLFIVSLVSSEANAPQTLADTVFNSLNCK